MLYKYKHLFRLPELKKVKKARFNRIKKRKSKANKVALMNFKLISLLIASFLGLIVSLRVIDVIDNFVKQKVVLNPVLQQIFVCFSPADIHKLNDLYILLFIVIFLYFIALILLFVELIKYAA